jgi:hypothetical protein
MIVALLVGSWGIGCTDANIGDGSSDADGGAMPATDQADAARLLPDGSPADAALEPLACTTEGDRRVSDAATGTCYYAFDTPAPWLVARVACQALGGDLARIDSLAENNIVFNLALNPPIALEPDWWVGGNDRTTEGRFVWLDDTVEIVPPLFVRWRTGEPNDNGGGLGEDCMIIESDNANRQWDDRNCTNADFPYICERAP